MIPFPPSGAHGKLDYTPSCVGWIAVTPAGATGWIFIFAGAASSWAGRGQLLPSLSSTEAELYGLGTGVCDMLGCVLTLEDMLVVFKAPVTVLTDSRGARLISDDHAASARTRHVHRR